MPKLTAHDGSVKGARAAFEEFKKKTREPWPDMDADLEECMGIMHKWFLRTGPLLLIDNLRMNGEAISYRLPAWQEEIKQHFTKKYGEEAGGEIFPKAMYRLIPIQDDEPKHIH
ncbi:hypothetical protein [uncultured Thiodictyon sp.]|uniref:hypothetical protein n=1 Tax=uncultured Thiodictyon sp. TaxID=1846217 RepID=UPI0025CD4F39|nr:hypothetical protein [uncultured Thiodictyon sp.]